MVISWAWRRHDSKAAGLLEAIETGLELKHVEHRVGAKRSSSVSVMLFSGCI
jgi:hypothetical protein